jgi:hypothetical protein
MCLCEHPRFHFQRIKLACPSNKSSCIWIQMCLGSRNCSYTRALGVINKIPIMRHILIVAFITLSRLLYSQPYNSYELYSLLIKDEFARESEIIAIENLTSLFDSLKDSDFGYLKQNFIDLKNETFESTTISMFL